MKIWGEISKILGVETNNKKIDKVQKTEKVEGKKDEVTISKNAKDYQTAMNAINNVPDIRQEKVDELKQKYDQGSLNVSGNDIAEKLLEKIKDNEV